MSDPAQEVPVDEREMLHALISDFHSITSPEDYPDLDARAHAVLKDCDGVCVPPPQGAPSQARCQCAVPVMDGIECICQNGRGGQAEKAVDAQGAPEASVEALALAAFKAGWDERDSYRAISNVMRGPLRDRACAAYLAALQRAREVQS